MPDTTENQPQLCRATTSKGKPCRAYVVGGGEYCFTHSPEHAKTRAEARRRGGENRSRPPGEHPFPPVKITSARGLNELVAQLIQDTWELPPSLSRARTLAILVNVQKDMIDRAEREAIFSDE